MTRRLAAIGFAFLMVGTTLALGRTPAFASETALSQSKSSKIAQLAVVATAVPTFNNKIDWRTIKTADPTSVSQRRGTATITYQVVVWPHRIRPQDWKVTGVITVSNPNRFDVSGVTVSDAVDDPDGSCVVSGGSNVLIPGEASVDLPYLCSYPFNAVADETNTATVSWPRTRGLAAGTARFDLGFSFSDHPADVIDDCVTVTDALDRGATITLGSGCADENGYPISVSGGTFNSSPPGLLFTYTRTFPVPNGCVEHDNSATATTNDTGSTSAGSASVSICGPVHTPK